MKAKERIERYGLKKYLKSCRKQGMSESRIERYKEKYGDIPTVKPEKVARPKRYKKSLWNIEMEREGETWKGVSASALHLKSDHMRDLNEAFRNAQYNAGESGWVLVENYEFLGYRKPYTEHYEYVEYRAPTKSERQTKIPEWKMKKGMEKVGIDPDKMKEFLQEMRK